MDRVVDTLTLARKRHPGQPNSLDALCDRYRIDRTRRVRHGALLDAEILVEVYCELTGGRQRSLAFSDTEALVGLNAILIPARSEPRRPRESWLEPEEAAVHARYIETLVIDAIWSRYLSLTA
jgi:DNA polymerase-3 subunit epsilon